MIINQKKEQKKVNNLQKNFLKNVELKNIDIYQKIIILLSLMTLLIVEKEKIKILKKIIILMVYGQKTVILNMD